MDIGESRTRHNGGVNGWEGWEALPGVVPTRMAVHAARVDASPPLAANANRLPVCRRSTASRSALHNQRVRLERNVSLSELEGNWP